MPQITHNSLLMTTSNIKKYQVKQLLFNKIKKYSKSLQKRIISKQNQVYITTLSTVLLS